MRVNPQACSMAAWLFGEWLDDGVLTRPMKRYAARLAELALPSRRCQLPT